MFDVVKLFSRKPLIVGDVQSAACSAEVRTCLEHMWAQQLTCSSSNDVDCCVMVHQLFSPDSVHFTGDNRPHLKRFIDRVENHISLFLGVGYREHLLSESNPTVIGFLPTAFRIEARGIKGD